MSRCSGLRDKIYWRPVGVRWCAFIPARFFEGEPKNRGGYRSLCDRHERPCSGGQASDRPPSLVRCPICDGREMDRRGWDEGGPTLPGWRAYLGNEAAPAQGEDGRETSPDPGTPTRDTSPGSR